MKAAMLLGAMLLVAVGWVWRAPVATHAQVLLLLAEELPHLPLKPLGLLTARPSHERLELPTPDERIVADVFLPSPHFGAIVPHSVPAIVLAMGVKTSEPDRPLLLGFAETLSRLGYVVIWPRQAALDAGVSRPEDPETFVAAVEYLSNVSMVDKERISLIGFSAGASLGLVAAADPRIADRVHSLVCFGGYYDIFAYLASLATHTSRFQDQEIAWTPSAYAVGHVREILAGKGAASVDALFAAATDEQVKAALAAAPPSEVATLHAMSPAAHLPQLRTRVFILHDKGDHFVPYFESLKLHAALAARPDTVLLVTDLFDHVQPQAGPSLQTAGDLLHLYGFVHAALSHFKA